MRPAEVFSAINAITAELAGSGIPKQHYNRDGDYFYRSIDDVLNRLAPLLAAHRLCILPRVLERRALERIGLLDTFLSHVTLKVAFDLVSVADGSSHTVKAFGEALDEGDKATAKAMSAAYKSAMLQTFCIPVAGEGDCDRQNLKICATSVPEPAQGWDQWGSDVVEIIKGCESEDALSRVRDSYRPQLKALQSARPDLYAKIGDEFAQSRGALTSTRDPTHSRRRRRSSVRANTKTKPAEMQLG